VNHPNINGKDGVAGSIPAGSSTTKRQARPGFTRSVACPDRAEPSVGETFVFATGALTLRVGVQMA
jgi:hypothetical protein